MTSANAFLATARYEFTMQWRKRSVWIVVGVLVLLLLLQIATGAGRLSYLFEPGDPRAAMARVALLLQLLLPVGFGCLLADRLIRDQRIRVAEVLDATPAGATARLIGKYTGSCAATAFPILALFLALAAGYGITEGKWSAAGWALAIFVVVMLPGLAFIGAAALAFPLVMPAPLFRVLFVGYWFWGNAVGPASMPTTAHTLLAPIGPYSLRQFFGSDQDITRPPGDPFNVLRPEVSAATAVLSITLLAVLTVLLLAGARAIQSRSTR
jgi:ABC-2 type transport system permease protein